MDNTSSKFAEELRRALRRLYDPTYMRKSPLLRLFGVEGESSPAEGLRRVIRAGIAALEACEGDPALPASSRCYQVLYYRYVQRFTQRDVASQLHISPRQLRREQSRAVEALADVLRDQLDLPTDVDAVLTREGDGEGEEERADQENTTVDGEMLWLGDSLADEVADMAETTREAIELAKVVASRYPVRLEALLDQDLPHLEVSATVLKQIVLNLLTPAIHCVAQGGTVALSATCVGVDVVIQVAARASSVDHFLAPEKEGLEMAERLVKLFEGKYEVSPTADSLTVRVTFPSAAQFSVMVIEDNLDTLQLWERYVHGSRFHITGVRNPHRALDIACELDPHLIILDVMMPGVDGWQLLAQLRHHPSTSHIPIIICTVLPQAELALALGANHFMRKPMTRATFLSALARQIEAVEPR